jgi:hypothetical protein
MCELIKLNVVGDYRAEGWNDGLFHFEWLSAKNTTAPLAE